jgi:hypothetical protein
MDCRKLPHHGEPSQLQRIVAVRLPLRALPSPRFMTRIRHHDLTAEFFTHILHPSGDRAYFEDNQAWLDLDDKIPNLAATRLDASEFMLMRVIIQNARASLAYPEIKSEDLHHQTPCKRLLERRRSVRLAQLLNLIHRACLSGGGSRRIGHA